MRVYKVLYRRYGQLTSAYVEGRYEQFYEPGEQLLCPNIFVFCDEELARNYASSVQELWLAETDEVRPAPAKILDLSKLDEYYDVYWEHRHERIWPDLLTEPPKGSFVCDGLTLLERIQ